MLTPCPEMARVAPFGRAHGPEIVERAAGLRGRGAALCSLAPATVTQRSVRSGGVFFASGDRPEHLRLLREQCEQHGVRILSYCLMTNDVHLIAVPEKSDCQARGIGDAHKRCTRRVNFREGVRGCLFRGAEESAALLLPKGDATGSFGRNSGLTEAVSRSSGPHNSRKWP